MKAGALQGTNRFKAAQYANRSVVHSGVGNRVDVRAGSDGRKIGLAAVPSRERIANGVFLNCEPGVFTERLYIGAGAQVSLAEDDARDHRRLRFRDLRERLQFVYE